MFIKGGQEATEMADVRKKERLLGMIQAAGKVSLASAAIELKMTRDQVKNAILDLVNQGLFSGYTNWQEQMFYSKDLSQMQTTKCPNCGGQREAVGKGLVKCPYCGVELFLPQS
jgi:tRNA(Ile2) C34 agmatinyltransferase TiaS